MDNLLSYIITPAPAGANLSIAFFFRFHNGCTDLDVVCGNLDCLCLCYNIMPSRHCEFKWGNFILFFLKATVSKG